jgi:hypothetical protein
MGWVEGQWRHILVIAAAAASYELAVVVEGSGFIAACQLASFSVPLAYRSAADAPRSAAADPQAGPS